MDTLAVILSEAERTMHPVLHAMLCTFVKAAVEAERAGGVSDAVLAYCDHSIGAIDVPESMLEEGRMFWAAQASKH